MQIPSTAIQTPALASGLTVLYDETLASDTVSFDVQNIPQGYKHIQIRITGRSTRSGQTFDFVAMRLNNDSGSNYDSQEMQADGTSVAGAQQIGTDSLLYFGVTTGATATADAPGQTVGEINNYAGTTFRKLATATSSAAYTDSSSGQATWFFGGEWRNTAAINRITLFPANGSWLAGSRLTIYGLGGTVSDEVPLLTGVRLKRDANQSCGTSAETPIPFDEVDVLDTNNFHDIVTENTKIIIPPGHAGYYDLRGEFSYQSGATGQRAGYLKQNNVTYIATAAGPGVATIGPTMQLSALGVYLGVGDYVQLVMWHNQGGAQNVSGSKLEAILRGHS